MLDGAIGIAIQQLEVTLLVELGDGVVLIDGKVILIAGQQPVARAGVKQAAPRAVVARGVAYPQHALHQGRHQIQVAACLLLWLALDTGPGEHQRNLHLIGRVVAAIAPAVALGFVELLAVIGGDDDYGLLAQSLLLQLGEHLLQQLIGVEHRVLVAILQLLQVLGSIGGGRVEAGQLGLEGALEAGGHLIIARAREIDQREPGSVRGAGAKPLLPVADEASVITLAGDKHLLAQAGEQALLILLGVFQCTEQAELVVLAQHLVEQHRRALVGTDIAIVVARQPVEEAEHPHGVIVAATHVVGKVEVLIRIALQIGHVDVVEHVGPQGVDHHHQQVLVLARRTHAEGAQGIEQTMLGAALVLGLLLILLEIEPAMLGQEASGCHGVGEREVGALHGDGLIQGCIGPAVDEVSQHEADQQGQSHLIAVLAAFALVDLAPHIGRQQQLQQEDGGHGDEDDAPDRALFGLGLIQQQLPHLAIQVELEQLEHLGVDEQQHLRQGGDDGRDEAQWLLSGQHEAQGEDGQQIGDEAQEREMTYPADDEIGDPERGRWPADGTQIAGRDQHGQEDVEEGEPMPPGDQARNVITIGVAGFDHNDPSA